MAGLSRVRRPQLSRFLTTVLAAVTLPLMPEAYEFFDPDQPVEDYYGCLPHWRQEGVLYFVTFRLPIRSRPTSFAFGRLREPTGCVEILLLTPGSSEQNTSACFPPA